MSRKPSMNPFRNRELATGLMVLLVFTIPMALIACGVVRLHTELSKATVLNRDEWKCTAFIAEPPQYVEQCAQWTTKELGHVR